MAIILGRKPGGGGGGGAPSGPAGGDLAGTYPNPTIDPTAAVISLDGGGGQLAGDVTLSAGTNVTLTQVGQDIEIAAAGGGLFASYALLRDQKAQNTSGGNSAATTWNIRALTTEVFDPDGIVALAANQFTPIAGTYWLRAWGNVAAQGLGVHRLGLWNDTAGAFVDYGASMYGDNAQNGSFDDNAEMQTRFTANGTDAYELQHYTQTAQTAAFGNPTNVAVEIYAEVLLMLEA